MSMFYFISAVFAATVFFSWLVNELPMEMPDDEFQDDWSKL